MKCPDCKSNLELISNSPLILACENCPNLFVDENTISKVSGKTVKPIPTEINQKVKLNWTCKKCKEKNTANDSCCWWCFSEGQENEVAVVAQNGQI